MIPVASTATVLFNISLDPYQSLQGQGLVHVVIANDVYYFQSFKNASTYPSYSAFFQVVCLCFRFIRLNKLFLTFSYGKLLNRINVSAIMPLINQIKDQFKIR